MQVDEFDELLSISSASEKVEDIGTPCRLIGRFPPVQGSLEVDCTAVKFRSASRLRQLSVSLDIPTRSILACTTEGCAVSLAVQGMAGRGVSFEFNSSAQCCQATLSLATAGQMSEEELDAGTEEDSELEGGCSAVLDEVVMSSRFSFALGSGCRLLAWERCKCLPVAHSRLQQLRSASRTQDPPEEALRTKSTQGSTPLDTGSGKTSTSVAGVLYVCEGGLIFLPDHFCKCSGEASLRAVATMLPKAMCLGVRQILGGVEVRGSWFGRQPCAQADGGWQPGSAHAHARIGTLGCDGADFALCFYVGLSKDFEALSHATYGLLQGADAMLLDPHQQLKGNEAHQPLKGKEADRARGKVWAKTYASQTSHQLRSDPAVRAALLGSFDSATSGVTSGGGVPAGMPASCRAMMWMKLSGAADICAAHPPQYAYRLLNHPPPGAVAAAAAAAAAGGRAAVELEEQMAKAEMEINKDVNRTFSDKEIRECLAAQGLDRSMPLQWFVPKLKRLLLAHARHNPSIGYCQSLNYLGGLIVIVVEPEEDCFWLLCALLHKVMPKSYYADLSGVMVDVEVMNFLLDRHLKTVKEKLELVHLPLTSFVTQWFMCAYVNVLPLASVLKVWDTLLLVGPVLLFRVALALLKAIEGELGVAREMEDAMAALQHARNLEIETILMIAHACFGEAVVDVSVLMQLRHKAAAMHK